MSTEEPTPEPVNPDAPEVVWWWPVQADKLHARRRHPDPFHRRQWVSLCGRWNYESQDAPVGRDYADRCVTCERKAAR